MYDGRILHFSLNIPCWYDDNFYYVLELTGDGPDTNGDYTGGFTFTADGGFKAIYYVKYDLYLVCKDKTKITKLPSAGYNSAREPYVKLSYTDAEETRNLYFYGISNNPDDEVMELPYTKDGKLIDRIHIKTAVNDQASNLCFWHEFSEKQEHKITIEGIIGNNEILKTNVHLSRYGIQTGDFSYEEKEQLKNGTAKVIARLICDSDSTESQYVLTGYDNIKSLTYTDERYVPDQGWIGQFVARTLNGDFHKSIADLNIENKEIEFQLGVIDNIIEAWHSFGKFVVTKPQDNNVSDDLKFTSMDYTKKFNKEFDGNFTNFRFTESLNTKITNNEKYTVDWLARYTCEQVGIEFASEYFTGYDFELYNNPFQYKETCRDVMKELAKLCLVSVRIDWDNRCYFDSYIPHKSSGAEYDSAHYLVPDEYFSLETQDEIYGPINKVVFGMEGIDGESVYVSDQESIEEHGVCAIYVYNNPLLDTFEIRDKAVKEIGPILYGIYYHPLRCETVGHPWIKPNDNTIVVSPRLSQDATIDDAIWTYPFNITMTYNGHIKTQFESIGETNVEATYAYESGLTKELKNAFIKVDKQNGVITEHTKQINTINAGLNNCYTKEQTNELINDATSGLTNTYTTSGGNNIFKNSGLYFEDSKNGGFEYWDGNIVVKRNVDSASGNSMLLQKGDCGQTVGDLPNGEYTVSFGYKKLNTLSTASVIINGITYSLDNQEKFEQTILVRSNSLFINFRCDTNNGYEVWELMCNRGTASQPWTQHANEVRTDMVNISKGITIKSSTIKSTFKADADGIRIENQSDNKTTEFTEDGMETDVAVVRNRGEITGVLFAKVGNQTWITGL